LLMGLKRIAIVGSTGSIGRQALEIIASEERFCACGLAAGSNASLLAKQARTFRPQVVALADADAAGPLRQALPEGTELLTGPEAAAEMIRRARPDLAVTAVVGAAGLAPTLAAIECGADLAVANKEALVMAGGVVMPAARAAGVNVLPVDSEHSAIFQCLAGHRREEVRRVILTASGGPFRTWSARRMQHASPDEALNHPTWRMGRKITIDSATLMNKALEVIEAHWLFGLSAEQIEIVLHPESLVHGCVEFCDGSILAQMGTASMATPIAFALYYPARCPRPPAPLEMSALGGLHFQAVDPQRFPAARLGHVVVRRGGVAGAVLSAANEIAVESFLAGRIHFGAIVEVVQDVLNRTAPVSEVNIDAILAADAAARVRAREAIRQREVLSAGRGEVEEHPRQRGFDGRTGR